MELDVLDFDEGKIEFSIRIENRSSINDVFHLPKDVKSFKSLVLKDGFLIIVVKREEHKVDLLSLDIKTKKINLMFTENVSSVNRWSCLKTTGREIFLLFDQIIFLIIDRKLIRRTYHPGFISSRIIDLNNEWIVYLVKRGYMSSKCIIVKNRRDKSSRQITDTSFDIVILQGDKLLLRRSDSTPEIYCYDLLKTTMSRISDSYLPLISIEDQVSLFCPERKVLVGFDDSITEIPPGFHQSPCSWIKIQNFHFTARFFQDLIFLRILLATRRSELNFFNHRDFFSVYLTANYYDQETIDKFIFIVTDKLYFDEKKDLIYYFLP